MVSEFNLYLISCSVTKYELILAFIKYSKQTSLQGSLQGVRELIAAFSTRDSLYENKQNVLYKMCSTATVLAS